MWAIALAVVTGVIGLLTKIGIDIRTEHLARKAVAAALAGELGASAAITSGTDSRNIKALAQTPYDERVVRLRGLVSLPSGHPVFDRVAEQNGGLSRSRARDIRSIQHHHLRAAATVSMSSDTFLQAPDPEQATRITVMADMFAQEIEGMRRTVAFARPPLTPEFSLLSKLLSNRPRLWQLRSRIITWRRWSARETGGGRRIRPGETYRNTGTEHRHDASF